MDEATIQAALRELGQRTFGTPPGCLRVRLDDLAARGVDPDEAIRWVKAHGGDVDRHEHRREGRDPSYGKLDVFVTLIVPEAVL